MKLNQEQILDIERYLDYHDLKQVDLRYEVLDHMAQSIEVAMEEGVSYVEAFNQQKGKWNPELKSYSTLWLGLAFVGPKMMMKKCVSLIKNIYLRAIPISVIIAIILSYVLEFIPNSFFDETLHIFVGLFFVLLSIVSFIWKYNIKNSNIKITYQYLCKTQLWGYWLCLFTYSMLIGVGQEYFSRGVGFKDLIYPIFLIVSSFYFFKVYKKHFSVISRKLA